MHLKSSLSILAVASALIATAPTFAQHNHHGAPVQGQQAAQGGQLIKVTEKDAAWAAKERANYPLDVCVTSDEKLGSMGKSPEYIYRLTGKPDRLVIFCCAGCDEDFLKDPVKHLAKIDAAKAGNAAGSSAAKDPHKGHH